MRRTGQIFLHQYCHHYKHHLNYDHKCDQNNDRDDDDDQDEHRITRLVLASQGGFALAREQDDVRRLQHRGGDGHHHTGDF